ncbi:MAG: SsrA-binding protein SmpB [Phycisphaeraceae bacterium]|nr:SsrA-binding protein SmpB [Phycisphaerae bacterium]MBX3392386.1 SsrA-binding protein SmpB [Phycisphaeraceae bacterium]
MTRKDAANPERTIENRKARHDYHILDTLECGIALRGSEVKSVRAGRISISEGFCRVEGDPPQLVMFQTTIEPYGPAGALQHSRGRGRLLLAHRREIRKLQRQIEQKGMTIVPLRLYFKNGFAKILVGVAKGKAAHDKRQTIAKRESDRDIARAMSKRRS